MYIFDAQSPLVFLLSKVVFCTELQRLDRQHSKGVIVQFHSHPWIKALRMGSPLGDRFLGDSRWHGQIAQGYGLPCAPGRGRLGSQGLL